jgi:intracellular sulfur oxidation DsrE/DsrF family protein
MAKKILSIVEIAHRATLEEQDDTVLWLTHAMRGAGADLTVVLRGNAVGYAVRGQNAAGLVFGDRRQRSHPRIGEDVVSLAAKGVGVLVVEEDLALRGIPRAELVDGVEVVPQGAIGELAASHDQVWHW